MTAIRHQDYCIIQTEMDCWFVCFFFLSIFCALTVCRLLCKTTCVISEHQNSPHDVGPSIDQSHLTTEKNGDAERYVTQLRTDRSKQELLPPRPTYHEELENYGLRAKSSLPHTLVNKALLEHSKAHLCIYRLWLLSCYNRRVEFSCDRDGMVQKD